MKILAIIILGLFNALSGSANTLDGMVFDKNNKPIEFCYIYLKSSGVGTVTIENGNFSIRIKQFDDTLVFKSTGYREKLIPLNKFDLNAKLHVVLESDVIILRELKITRKRKPNFEIIGNLQNKSNYKHILSNGTELATRFEVSQFPCFVTEISLRLNNVIHSTAIPIRIKIYDVDSLSGKPQNELLRSNVIISKKVRDAWISIDLMPFFVLVESRHFFIAVETFEWSTATFNFGDPPKRNEGLFFPFTKTSDQQVYFRHISTTGIYKWSEFGPMSPLIRAKVTVD